MTSARSTSATAPRLRRRDHDPLTSYRAVDDGVLLASARAGDERAFAVLVERYRDMVRVVCRRYLSRGYDVDDAVQETFARVWQHLGTLRDPARFGGWLRTTAMRVAIDTGRSALAVTDRLEVVVDDAPAPEERAVAAETARELHARLAELTHRDRGALWMRDAHGASVAEVADFLGVTEGSARVALTRARHKLRAAYGNLVAAPLIALRDRLRRLHLPVGPDQPWGVSIAQASLAVALLTLPPGIAERPEVAPAVSAPSATVTTTAAAAPAHAPAAPIAAAPAGAIGARSSSAIADPADSPGTFVAPWRDTRAGPLVVDDEPGPATQRERVTVEDDTADAEVDLEIGADTTLPDVSDLTATTVTGGTR